MPYRIDGKPLTFENFVGVEQTAAGAGFDHYLVKPADPMKLVGLLSNVPTI
jgi:hypothetical protein